MPTSSLHIPTSSPCPPHHPTHHLIPMPTSSPHTPTPSPCPHHPTHTPHPHAHLITPHTHLIPMPTSSLHIPIPSPCPPHHSTYPPHPHAHLITPHTYPPHPHAHLITPHAVRVQTDDITQSTLNGLGRRGHMMHTSANDHTHLHWHVQIVQWKGQKSFHGNSILVTIVNKEHLSLLVIHSCSDNSTMVNSRSLATHCRSFHSLPTISAL